MSKVVDSLHTLSIPLSDALCIPFPHHEDEQYINRESFMEWVAKEPESAELATIRSKLIAALSGDTETKANPLQDLQDEDDIVEILGANQLYIAEMEQLRNRKESTSSNGTTKIKDSQSGDEDDDDDEEQSDSMDSAERREILQRKQEDEAMGRTPRGSPRKGTSRKGTEEDSEQMEASLIEQQMAKIREQQKYALERTVSGRNTFKIEDADKWKDDEIRHEMDEMKAMHRRLSTGSLTIDQIEQEAKEHVAAFRKLSAPQTQKDSHTVPVGTFSVTAPSRVPSKDNEDYDLLLDVAPTIRNKTMPPKSGPSAETVHVASHPIAPHESITGHHSAASSGSFEMGGVSLGADGGAGGGGGGSRRNSYSMSHSQHSQAMMNGADISQYTASGAFYSNSTGSLSSSHRVEANPALRVLHWYLGPLRRRESVLRLWYHGANAVLSMAIFVAMASMLVLAIGLTPFCGIGLIFLYFECVAARHLVAVDARCCSYLFGDGNGPKLPTVVIPAPAPNLSLMGQLREYLSDPHIVSTAMYFIFMKLPCAVVLSGSSLVMLSGVVSILMSPLVYWLQPDYFRHDRYCLFGTTTYDADDIFVECSGWAISSFGETFIAALAFLPALPLTLHLSNTTAKLLHSITTNALSIHSHSDQMTPHALGQPLHRHSNMNLNAAQSPHQALGYGNMNINGGHPTYH